MMKILQTFPSLIKLYAWFKGHVYFLRAFWPITKGDLGRSYNYCVYGRDHTLEGLETRLVYSTICSGARKKYFCRYNKNFVNLILLQSYGDDMAWCCLYINRESVFPRSKTTF